LARPVLSALAAEASWLDYYAKCFGAVEVNNTFYRLPQRAVFARWATEVPKDFVIAPKISRYLTHILRLRSPGEPMERFISRADALEDHLGPLLLQLPPSLDAGLDLLDGVLALAPRHARVAVEVRHESWYTDDFRDLLRRHDAALCLADRKSRPITPLWRTASWGYVRLHEGRGAGAPGYGRTALNSWAARIAELWPDDADVFVFFNNDHLCHAVEDAHTFALAARRHHLQPTRTPAPRWDVRQ
jgi:uncharacterized protein YecE (DUF72 family)